MVSWSRTRIGVVAAALLVAVAAVVVATRQGITSEDEPPASTPIIVTMPAEVPTPHEFADGDEVIAYVLAILDIAEPPIEAYAARSRELDIRLMQSGPGSRVVTPDPSVESDPLFLATPSQGEIVWIVGLRPMVSIANWKLDELMGFPLNDNLSPDETSSEVYLILDDAGNVVGTGNLDITNADGLNIHAAPWQLSDITLLPTPAP